MFKFDPQKVTFSLHVQPDDESIRGNASVSDDEVYDRSVEDEIIRRLEAGDVWAWAYVLVEARYDGVPDTVGTAGRGGCNYADEADFCQPGGCYDDMKDEASADLLRQLDQIHSILCED